MSQPHKRRRSYDSTHRRLQAQETRRRILEAARRLFVERGYSGATLEAMARDAGVAPETVFSVFGNKRTILASLVGMAVAGDDQPTPLLKRPGPRAVLEESEPARKLELFAQDMAGILERVSPLFEVMRMAAKTEPEIADLLQGLLEDRLRTLGKFTRNLASHAPLREGLNQRQAAEIVWALTSPELFNLLITDRDWSMDRYVRWLGDALSRLLLA